MAPPEKEPVLELKGVCKAFTKPSGEPLPVLSGIDICLRDGEILGLLGRSGSGKSTVLRIAAGLIKPSEGQVLYQGRPLNGPAAGIAMVFQTFALFPWLTVLENVEAGLDALGLGHAEVRRRALQAIALIGLEGFQSAYPRELSGGMRQRVGFARAIVINPVLLLMDEPFSALDVLTSETLRTDFLDLWQKNLLPTKSVFMVTHNIEEAVLMCDRILVLSSNPGRIAAEIPIGLSEPRNRLDEEFRAVVDEIYAILTTRTIESIGATGGLHQGLFQPLPRASVSRMNGLLETLAGPPYDGQADLAVLARRGLLEIDDLFPIAEALQMLEFAQCDGSSIRLTPAGGAFVNSDTDSRKRLFKAHLLRFVPLSAHINRILKERAGQGAPSTRFLSELEDHLTKRDAEQTLRAATAWGRYAGLFAYDDKARMFSALP
jgi:NitT/TauT family transport system ATP-binding protein